MSRDYLNTNGHYIFSLSIKDNYYLMFFRYGYKGKKIWYGPKDRSDPEYDSTIYDVWNCKIIDKLVVKKWHDFEFSEWTVLKLVKQ